MGVHIGQEIEKKFKESDLKIDALAKAINTTKRNVYAIFRRGDISVGQLQKIGEVLKFDFLELYHRKTLEVAEPSEKAYGSSRRDIVPVIVELDGTERTLSLWHHRLESINNALKPREASYPRPQKHA